MKCDSCSNNLIVFCPGYTGLPPKDLNPLLKRFAKDSFDTYSVNYRYFGRGSIEASARLTNRLITPLRDHYDHITLVGHSMGGLVARKALNLSPQVADSLITLGSPHRGIQAAIKPFWWIGGKSVKEMGRTSRFLTQLDIEHLMGNTPTLAISGQYDLIVKDASINIKDDLITNLELPASHLSLITSSRVYGEIYSWLVYNVLDKTHV